MQTIRPKNVAPSINAAEIIMAVFIVISTFGCNNGLILGGPRVYYAMANDRLFFKKLSFLHPSSTTLHCPRPMLVPAPAPEYSAKAASVPTTLIQ